MRNMKNLPKKILNYFATFTETRFNFKRHINYKWTNNELTLDLSLFPEFQITLLNKIKDGDLSPVIIKQGEHTISIPKDLLLIEIEKLFNEQFNKDYLEKCIFDEFAQVAEKNKIFNLDDNGNLKCNQDTDDAKELLAKQKKLSQMEAIQTFNINFRRKLEKLLNELLEKIVNQKKDELNIDYTTSSIFSIANYTTQQYDQLKKISRNFSGSDQYIHDILKYFTESIENIVI
ncbi:MAG: hypothetical protein L7F78_25290, partial [Syntrophales bacterium LBB04]|nr:hypothetical protein [Syntrophales bacterium LBB04]